MIRKVLRGYLPIILLAFTFERCAYNDLSVKVDCTTTSLAIALDSKSDVTSCKSIDGSITVSATGGLEPYDFSINGGQYQTNSQFIDLGAGVYTVKVKDKNNCERSIEVTLAAAGSNLRATASTVPDNECSGNNGSITIAASGGTGPYQYQLNTFGYGTANSFNSLKDGQYIVVVKDANECQTTLSVEVPRGNTGISYSAVVKGILDTNCNLSGCHGSGTGSRDWTNLTNLKNAASNIKTRTTNKTMPPGDPLPQDQIDKIACWADDGAPTNN